VEAVSLSCKMSKLKITIIAAIGLFSVSLTPFTLFKIKPSIVASELNIIYRHISNPVSIDFNNYSAKKTEVKATGATISKTSKLQQVFGVVADKDVNEATITVGENKKNGKYKSVTDQKFRIRELPEPVFQLGGVSDKEEASISALLIQNRLHANSPQSFPYKLDFEVVKYDLSIFSKKGKSEYKGDNDKLTLEIKNEIRKLKTDDILIFKNITYTLKNSVDGFKATAGPLVYVIK
jgi:hypothetical protein